MLSLLEKIVIFIYKCSIDGKGYHPFFYFDNDFIVLCVWRKGRVA